MPDTEPSLLRGVRGATVAERNDAEAILDATERLLREMVAANALEPERIASAFFTVTPDLTAAFPAVAARRMGWTLVPLLNGVEIDVEGGLARCIRVLVHVNTTVSQREVAHVYLGEARALRPDLPATPSMENAQA